MTKPDKLTVDEVSAYAEDLTVPTGCNMDDFLYRMACQFADTMRENEMLLKHPPMLICEKCNHVNTIHPYNEPSDVG